jgi:DNA-binding NarL/FixJ family response regulator
MTNENSEITVLIVDDHPMVREGLRSMLTAPGIRVVGDAKSGQKALELVKKLQPDVTLLDIRMPDMNGIQVLEAIKTAKSPTLVIMVTTYKNLSYLLRSLAAGASGFILKDISRDNLLATVKAIASGASMVDRVFLQEVLRTLDDSKETSTEVVLEQTDPLTPREMDVLRLMVEGLTNRAIANILNLSPGTVKGYVKTILEKLLVSDRTQAAVKAIRTGLVT